jgi:hypothetical protein
MDKVIPVKVVLRIRPLVSKENTCTECLRTVDSTQVLNHNKIFFIKFKL